MKKGAVLLPLLLLVIVVACSGVSATQVERDLYANLDKGDVAGALALTTEDAVFDIPGCPEGGCKGKDAVKGAFERVVALHPRHTVKSSKASGNTATSQVEDELDLAKAAGVQRVVLKVNLEVKSGKIVRYRAQFDTSDQQTATFLNFQQVSGLHRQFVDAVARGDVSGALALFNDDAIIEGRGVCAATPCVGKEAIRKEVERVVNNHSTANLTNVQVSGNATTARLAVQSDATRAAGVERLVGDQTLEERGGKIAAIRFKIDASDQQTATFQNFGRLSRILRQHVDAINRDDVPGALATLTDDAEYVRGIRCRPERPCKGKEAIQRDALEFDVRFNNRYTIVKLEASGDTVTARAEYRGQGTRDAGVERAIHTHTVTFRGDKISRYITETDRSDPQTAAQANFGRVAAIVVRQGDALHRGDVAGVMAIFTDDTVYDGLGLCASASCTGKAAVQKEMERQVTDKIRITRVLGTFRVSGNTATARAEIQSDSIKAAGLERIIASVTAEVPQDKITSLRYALDATDPQTTTYLKAAILRQHIDAINRDDVPGALATLTDDAEYVRGARCRLERPCVGKPAIQRDALEFDVRFNNRYTIISIQVSGETATARVENRGQATRDAGVERQIQIHTVTFKGDKFSRFVAQSDTTDAQTAVVANFGRIAAVALRPSDGVNRGEVAFAMAAFADDASFEGFGLCAAATCVGKAAIQKELERQVADKTNVTTILGTARVSGNTQTFRLEIRSDSIKAAGVERIIITRTTEVPRDKITSLRWEPDTTDPQTATYLKSQAK